MNNHMTSFDSNRLSNHALTINNDILLTKRHYDFKKKTIGATVQLKQPLLLNQESNLQDTIRHSSMEDNIKEVAEATEDT